MAEYISREAALESVREKVLICESLPDTIAKDASLFTLASMNDSLNSIPAADVRPVVTCIECKHSCDMPGGLRCCHGTCVDCYVDPEFFCADGEKREEA